MASMTSVLRDKVVQTQQLERPYAHTYEGDLHFSSDLDLNLIVLLHFLQSYRFILCSACMRCSLALSRLPLISSSMQHW